MTTKRINKKETNGAPLESEAPVLRSYFIPTLGVSIEASSQDEAIKLALEQKDEGGDGNV